MSWTDEEIDNLFQESAKAQSFEYNNAYFSEVEGMLPVNKKGKDFLWMGTALLFIAVLTTGYFVNDENTINGANDQLADVELNNKKETPNNSTAQFKENQTNNTITSEGRMNSEPTEANTASDNMSNRAEDGDLNKSWYTPAQQMGWSKSMYNLNPEENTAKTKVAANNSGSNIEGEVKDPLINLTEGVNVKNKKEINVNRAPISAALEMNSANQLDQGLDRTLIPNTWPVLRELRPKSALYIELNAGMSQSLVTPQVYTSTSYGVGIGVESHLGKFNLTTGLNFKVSDHKGLVLTRVGMELYGFGSTDTGTNEYDFKQVYAFELPISLGYNFGKHNVNIGVRPSLSFGAKMKERELIGQELVSSDESVGLLDGGLKLFGVKPTFGYSYHMNKWTIGANIGVQLLESIDEEYIKGSNTRFPLDGQLYLRRTIRLRR